MEFRESLAKHFKVWRNHVARGRGAELRNRGRYALARVMADLGFRSGVEVGTERGSSAVIWCAANPQLHLTCIDPYGSYRNRRGRRQQDAAYAEACKTLSPFNVTMVRKPSLAVVDRFPDGSLDMIHIDGDHSFDACMMDLIKWAPKVRPGGVIALHDYCSTNWNGVTQAVNCYLFAHGINEWYITPDVSPSIFWERKAE
jgi:predicted O-methyltransferase YrrM